jgi:PTS system mannose-specific IIA component
MQALFGCPTDACSDFCFRRVFPRNWEGRFWELCQASGTAMIGLIIVTHGNLAREFVAALEHVVGPQQQVVSVSIFPNDDMEERRNAILDAVKTAGAGDGVIILTDMFGGTPSNLAISVMDSGSIEVIAGVNLPMLVKLARIREEATLEEALKQAQDAGRKYIHVASLVLNAR